MTPRKTALLALALVAPVTFQACATKRFVRQEVAVERNQRIAADNALTARDNELSERIAALRADLDTLRRQFNVRIAAVEDGLLFVMPVNFAYNDATVRQQAEPLLKRFVRVTKKYYPSSTITVAGCADPAGSQAYNLTLSRRRAENVRRELTELGLTGNTVRVIGYGESMQVHPGAMGSEPGAEANRRVVFVIESVGQEGRVAVGSAR
ncbi:MAG TPA: OmpA family protein [Gemmatimonadaceae bacterium]|nr:OmpA family protein [Gemmatimonadaceae bacterium]